MLCSCLKISNYHAVYHSLEGLSIQLSNHSLRFIWHTEQSPKDLFPTLHNSFKTNLTPLLVPMRAFCRAGYRFSDQSITMHSLLEDLSVILWSPFKICYLTRSPRCDTCLMLCSRYKTYLPLSCETPFKTCVSRFVVFLDLSVIVCSPYRTYLWCPLASLNHACDPALGTWLEISSVKLIRMWIAMCVMSKLATR